jgi:hypothetical protein
VFWQHAIALVFVWRSRGPNEESDFGLRLVLQVLSTAILIESSQVCWVRSVTGHQCRSMAAFVMLGLEGNNGLSAATEKMLEPRIVAAKTR